MYEQVFHSFGLRENPFGVSPDPRFYVSMPAYDAALAKFIGSVDSPEGFLVLTGEAGTGKTTLLNQFLNWLRKRQRSSSYVFHPRLKSVELFDCILRDFGVPCEVRDKQHLLMALRQWLIGRHAMGDTPIVVIDEAQAISVRTLDQLRHLLNLEAYGKKLLPIVLAGQSELEDKLRQSELRRLRARITSHCRLQQFSLEETSQYVKSKLACAGATNLDVFAMESLEMTHEYSRGVPRTLNLLCEQALIAGYADGVEIISPDIIRQVAADFDLAPQWAVTQEPGISAKFRGLAPIGREESRVGVSPGITLLPATPKTKMLEPELEIPQLELPPLQEVEATQVAEGPRPEVLSAVQAVDEPVAFAVPALPQVLPQIAELHNNSQNVTRTRLSVRWQSNRLEGRWGQHSREVRAAVQREWKRFTTESASLAKSVSERVHTAKVSLSQVVQTIAKRQQEINVQFGRQMTRLGARISQYSAEMRAAVPREWKRFTSESAKAAKLVNERVHAAKVLSSQVLETRVSRMRLQFGREMTRLGARMSQYSAEVQAAVQRGWKRFTTESATAAKLVNERVHSAKVSSSQVMQTRLSRMKLQFGRQMTWLGERLGQSSEEVRATVRRGWQRLTSVRMAKSANESGHAAETSATPKQAARMKLQFGRQMTRLGERLKQSSEEMRAAVQREWQRFTSVRTAKSTNEPEPATEPFLHIMQPVTKASATPKLVSRMKLQIGRQVTRLGARLRQYFEEVRASFQSEWQRFTSVRAARFANDPEHTGKASLPHIIETVAKRQGKPQSVAQANLPFDRQSAPQVARLAHYRDAVRGSLVRDWRHLTIKFAPTRRGRERVQAAKPSLPYLVEPNARLPKNRQRLLLRKAPTSGQKTHIGERFVNYCKEVQASFVRDWKQFVGAQGTAWAADRKRR